MRTIRAKLTLMTMTVMGCLLIALGLVGYFGAQRTMLGSVDREMLARAFGMAHPRRPGGPQGPGPNGPPGGPGGPPPEQPQEKLGTGPSDLRPVLIRFHGPTRPIPPQFIDQPYDKAAVEASKGGWKGFSDITVDGNHLRVYTAPRIENGDIVAVVQLGYNLTDIQRSLANLKWVLLVVVVPVGVFLAGLASLFIVERLLRPLRQMTATAGVIGAASLSDRLPVKGEDEFAGLATTLNAMLGRIESAFEQEQESKRQLEETIQQQRRFTADASHELKTPLTVVKANAGLALNKNAGIEDARESLKEIDAAADRMSRLVNDLLTLARVDAGHLADRFEEVDLGQVLERAVGQVPGAKDRAKVEVTSNVKTLGSPDDLTRVFVNLLDNALRYGADPVNLSLAVTKGLAEVTIADHGAGIPPEHIEHLFDRFYRVDKSRSSETGGTGLGLAICQGIVEAHRGTISITSQPQVGTTVVVSLPIA
jgi:signal transduction histidine kinase